MRKENDNIKDNNNDKCRDGMGKNASGRTGSASATKAEKGNSSGSLEYLTVIEKPLNPAPESANVQEASPKQKKFLELWFRHQGETSFGEREINRAES